MRQYYDVNRLYRDKLHGKVSGVCAGIARHYAQPRWAIRLLALVSLVAFPLVTAVAYILAVMLIPSR